MMIARLVLLLGASGFRGASAFVGHHQNLHRQGRRVRLAVPSLSSSPAPQEQDGTTADDGLEMEAKPVVPDVNSTALVVNVTSNDNRHAGGSDDNDPVDRKEEEEGEEQHLESNADDKQLEMEEAPALQETTLAHNVSLSSGSSDKKDDDDDNHESPQLHAEKDQTSEGSADDIQLEIEEPLSSGSIDENDEKEDDINVNESQQIARLQKKLRYWKREQKDKENAYQQYVQTQMKEKRLKPIYERVGKIDTYKPRPLFDAETERIQTEIWSIKGQIKLTTAKLEEERRIEKVREETAQRLSENNAEIRNLKDQLESFVKKFQVQSLFRKKAKTLKIELGEAKKEQEQIRKEAESNLRAVKAEFTSSMEKMREESSQRLSEKELEINNLKEEIDGLMVQLQGKRNELNVKETVISSLESTLQEKESTLETLSRERASLRALARQSWKVLKSRIKRRLGRGAANGSEELGNIDKEVLASGDQDSNQNSDDGKSKVLVGKRSKKSG